MAESIKVYIPEHLRAGIYSNIANVQVSKNEVILDFIFTKPEEATLVSRVVLSIEHAKSLEKVLSNILKDK